MGLVVIDFHDTNGHGEQVDPESAATEAYRSHQETPPGEQTPHTPTATTAMARLLLADRIKGRDDTFLAPLIPPWSGTTTYASSPPRPGPLRGGYRLGRHRLAGMVLGSCGLGYHSDCLIGKNCVIRLHSIEALQTAFPAKVELVPRRSVDYGWRGHHGFLFTNNPSIARHLRPDIIPNGIDMDRFGPGQPIGT